MPDTNAAEANGNMTLPRWFLLVATGVLALAIPWAGWVTMTLATISVRIETQVELRRDTTELRRDLSSTQQIAGRLEARLEEMERRIKKLEDGK